MLVNGIWQGEWDPVQAKDTDGRFVRQTSSFRNWVHSDHKAGQTGSTKPDETSGFTAQPGRYHLIVGLICPWASRTLMVRKVKGLEEMLPVTVIDPVMTEQGWRFSQDDQSITALFGDVVYLHEIYTRADPNFTGRATVPVLWDKQQQTIVNNESADIMRMLNIAFDEFVGDSVDLYPEDLRPQIDALSQHLYENFNNGVYKAGFATSQFAYDEAVSTVFTIMDELEERLAKGKNDGFLFGERLTETDIRLFVTLIRFDAAYHGQFKCNLCRLIDYPRLWAYTKAIHDLPGIAETVNMDHIKRGYYSLNKLNPFGIVPAGPEDLFTAATA